MLKKSLLITTIVSAIAVIAIFNFNGKLTSKQVTTSSKLGQLTPQISKLQKSLSEMTKNTPWEKILSIQFDAKCNIQMETTSENISITSRYNENGSLRCQGSKTAVSPNGKLAAFEDQGVTTDRRLTVVEASSGKFILINQPNIDHLNQLAFVADDRIAAVEVTKDDTQQVTIYNLAANNTTTASYYMSTEPVPSQTTTISFSKGKITFINNQNQVIKTISL